MASCLAGNLKQIDRHKIVVQEKWYHYYNQWYCIYKCNQGAVFFLRENFPFAMTKSLLFILLTP